jgi:tRNA1Val (adenine37-N6)-methyltransferase
MGEKTFKFKQFQICQSDSVMKVGTDGVLIGAAVNCENASRVLDVGTGTGLIALMIAQKCNADIYAIDINPESVEIANRNVSDSKYSNRVTVTNTSIQNYSPEIKFDLIVSNPPYFTTKIIAPDKYRAIARHDTELTIADFVENAVRLLTENGRICVIYPPEQMEIFIKLICDKGFFVNSKINVLPRNDMEIVRVITEISKEKTEALVRNIAIENSQRHDFTEEYKALTSDYYLKF